MIGIPPGAADVLGHSAIGHGSPEGQVPWRGRPGRTVPWRSLSWRTIAVTALLAGVVVGWAAVPMSSGSGGAVAALVVAIVAGVLSIAQLLVAGIGPSDGLGTLPEQLADSLLGFVNWLPWAELLTIAAVALEALHPAKPWHTGVLGVALLGYLFAVHLAETGARPRVLRPQLGLLAAGVGLLALAVGAAALPALPSGLPSSIIRVAAVAAAVIAGALTFPVWMGKKH
jgi:hypothetical protein